MILKRIYIFILEIWKTLITYYDNSLIGRGIAGISSFFERRCMQSRILSRFKARFMSTDYVKSSVAFKIISLPFTILKSVYLKFENSIETTKQKSLLLDFLRNIPYLRIRDIGKALTSFGMGGLIVLLFKGFALSLGGLFLAVMLLAGLIMLLVSSTVRNTLSSSITVKFICSLLFTDDISCSDKVYEVKCKKLLYIIPALTGAVCCYISLPLMLFALLAALFIILVLWKTIFGVYVFVAFSAILPTMALVGVIALTLVSYGLHLALGKKATYTITPFTMLIALFLFLAAFSAFTSVSGFDSIKVFLVYFVFTIAFTLIVNTVKTKAQYKSLLSVFTLTAFCVAAYGVVQNFTLVQTTQSWVDTEMFEDIKTRVFSTLDNPNILGQFLILSIPLTLSCMMAAKKPLAKLCYMGMLAIGALCLLFTWSRAAWVGVVLAIGIMLLKKDKRFLGVCVAALVLAPFILPESILQRITSIGNTGDSSTSYRISVWIASIYMVRDFFFTGVGLGPQAFSVMYRNYALGGASFALHAHNFYLQWVADMGIGGLIVFALIILTAYKCISNIKTENKLVKYTGFAIAGSIIGYLFQGMAETMWYNYHMILIFWIFMSFIQLAAKTPKGEDADD